MRILDSRRLRGPNLASRTPGAIAEVALEPGESADGAEALWRRAVSEMAAALGRPELGEGALVRHFSGGLALMIPAPIDALYAAADLVEWGIESASLAPSVADRERERVRLARTFRDDASPELVALEREARARGVPFLWDDELVTLGHAARARSFALDGLPMTHEVPWSALGAIPVALVTGTNGKTTTTRLVARMAKLAGLVPGVSSSDGVAIDERIVEAGDWTGAEAARKVLRHPEVGLAVLETARGGILRRGLAVERCDAAIVTNVSADHLGELGVLDLATMARVKMVVGHAVRPGGMLVVNADDPELLRLASEAGVTLVLFSMMHDASDIVRAHLAAGGHAFVIEAGALVHLGPDGRDLLLPLDEVPLTFGGAARHNVENALGAAALGFALALPRNAIESALRTFGASDSDNPGRGAVLDLDDGVRVLLDFAHNRAGLCDLYALARTLVTPGRSILAVTVQAGDRSDEDFSEFARSIVLGGAMRVLLWESERLLRGRMPGETVALLERELVRHGLPSGAVEHAGDEHAAVLRALELARSGDLVVVAPHLTRGGELDAFLRGRTR